MDALARLRDISIWFAPWHCQEVSAKNFWSVISNCHEHWSINRESFLTPNFHERCRPDARCKRRTIASECSEGMRAQGLAHASTMRLWHRVAIVGKHGYRIASSCCRLRPECEASWLFDLAQPCCDWLVFQRAAVPLRSFARRTLIVAIIHPRQRVRPATAHARALPVFVPASMPAMCATTPKRSDPKHAVLHQALIGQPPTLLSLHRPSIDLFPPLVAVDRQI